MFNKLKTAAKHVWNAIRIPVKYITAFGGGYYTAIGLVTVNPVVTSIGIANLIMAFWVTDYEFVSNYTYTPMYSMDINSFQRFQIA